MTAAFDKALSESGFASISELFASGTEDQINQFMQDAQNYLD
jgi:hypothetical protein